MASWPAPGPLRVGLDALCRRLRPGASTELGTTLDDVLSGLHAPVRVVVTGDVSVGKSTLVNALLGRVAAPAGAGGCTAAPTCYRAGGWEIVDTPGLNAPAAAPVDVTDADAVLHVVSGPGPPRVPEPAPGVPVLGVLTRTDLLDPGTDGSVRAAGQRLARDHGHLARTSVLDVLPVVALLGQSCGTGAFTEADADAVRAVAALPEATRTTVLAAPDLFRTVAVGPAPAVRARLLELLDLYGIGCAVRLLVADPELSAQRLGAALYRISGIAHLRDTLVSRIRERADVVRAGAALRRLEPLVPVATGLAEGVESLWRLPEAHGLRLARVVADLRAGTVTFADERAEEVRSLGLGGDPGPRLGRPGVPMAGLAEHALARARWWRAAAVLEADPVTAEAAHVVHRQYFLLLDQLGARP